MYSHAKIYLPMKLATRVRGLLLLVAECEERGVVFEEKMAYQTQKVEGADTKTTQCLSQCFVLFYFFGYSKKFDGASGNVKTASYIWFSQFYKILKIIFIHQLET